MKALCTILLAVLICGCSTVRLVYDNADTYIRWRASSYLDLEGPMAEDLDETVGAFMAWHRTNALPKYAALADEASTRFGRGLVPADLDWGYDSVMTQARESVRVAAERIAPLLDRLTPEQIAHLERRLAEDNRRFARENLRGNERERRKRRTQRNVERLEDWLGRLSQAQIDRVAQYSERAPLLDEHRERDHKRLQAEVLALLRARQARERLVDFAGNWDRGRDPAYATAIEASRKEYFSMALDLERSLSSRQRARAASELRRYANEFRTLTRESR
ncbi:MAG TPA: DUF6279 family lipoprotein [Burkholderiales bacterium]|nr:DUF6279 family lipoprotein [Burkholderiales bacterium]